MSHEDHLYFASNVKHESLEEQPSTSGSQRKVNAISESEALEKIRSIIRTQFDVEIANKEREVDHIDHNIVQVKKLLDYLRACIVAKYYAVPSVVKSTGQTDTVIHPAVRKLLGKAPKVEPFKNAAPAKPARPEVKPTCLKLSPAKPVGPAEPTYKPVTSSERHGQTEDTNRFTKFKVKRKIIIGNVSKYITADMREAYDRTTHKWMMYVRGPQERPAVNDIIKKVRFFLHPSYKPYDIVEITEPPFHLSRRGWGEFPIRVQLHFKDERNKPVNLLHPLKLDKTHTGLQTLGAETIVNVCLLPSRECSSTETSDSVPPDHNRAETNVTTNHELSPMYTQIKAEPEPITDFGDQFCFDVYNEEIHVVCEEEVATSERDFSELKPNGFSCNPKPVFSTVVKRTSMKSILKKSDGFCEPLSKRARLEMGNNGVTVVGGGVNGVTAKNKEDVFVQVMDAKGNRYLIPNKAFELLQKSANLNNCTVSNLLAGKERRVQDEFLIPECVGNGKSEQPSRSLVGESNAKRKEEEALFSRLLDNCDTVEQAVFRLLKACPLDNSRKLLGPIAAKSREAFCSWSVAKKSALEWNRAKLIRNQLIKSARINPAKHRWKPADIWSCKRIFLCGRRYGYTPLEEQEEADNPCSAATKETKTTYSDLNAIAGVSAVLSRAIAEFGADAKPTTKAHDEIVDVETVDATSTSPRRPCRRFRTGIRRAPRTQWVWDAAKEVDVFLEPVEEFPLLEQILLLATKSFAEDLIRRSHAFAIDSQKDKLTTPVVQVKSVLDAVRSSSSCDFLTNSHLASS